MHNVSRAEYKVPAMSILLTLCFLFVCVLCCIMMYWFVCINYQICHKMLNWIKCRQNEACWEVHRHHRHYYDDYLLRGKLLFHKQLCDNCICMCAVQVLSTTFHRCRPSARSSRAFTRILCWKFRRNSSASSKLFTTRGLVWCWRPVVLITLNCM